MRILILEDNVTLAMGLKKTLCSEGYAVDVFHDGEEGASVLEYQEYDLLLLDLGLPSIDGIEILKRIRKNQKKIPVIIISARDKLDQKVLGLESGADDYLCKPFERAEVIARVHAILRRVAQNGQSLITIGDFLYNTTTRTLSKNDIRIELSNRELSVFEYLITHANQVVSKDSISEHITSFGDDLNSTAVETYVSRIRKKTGDSMKLNTVHGLGYILLT
ncbi:response regulator transcription factor [Sulfurospirillum arcachonense]|uniref:response regulator transcription factor n=1 Tax=Sulfurospirillum arcachonense TaxID=57666 RepID=UPI00046ADCF1|nr:response regulator transcription factor [Sulfurospirillum arcachonense]